MNDSEKEAWKAVVDETRITVSTGDSSFYYNRLAYALNAASAELTRLSALEAARFTAPIVCICGSTRFKQAWIAENARLTGEGNIVLAVGLWGHHERVFPDEATKKKLDELHLRKIDLCDWVWVLDVGGYIGESTRNEIRYANELGKTVRYLSNEYPGYVEPVDPLSALEARCGDVGPGAMAALEERIRQKSVEGWTPDHDAQHSQGELAIVAACYALNKMPTYADHWFDEAGEWWPWHPDWDKREKHSRERSLAIAAALCMAEIDRISRSAG